MTPKSTGAPAGVGTMAKTVPGGKSSHNPIVRDQLLTQGADGKWVLTGKDKAGKSVSIPWDLQKNKPLETKPEETSGKMAKSKAGLSVIEGGGKHKAVTPHKSLWNPKQYKPGSAVVLKSDGGWMASLAPAAKGKTGKPKLHQPAPEVTKVTVKDELSTPYERLKATV